METAEIFTRGVISFCGHDCSSAFQKATGVPPTVVDGAEGEVLNQYSYTVRRQCCAIAMIFYLFFFFMMMIVL